MPAGKTRSNRSPQDRPGKRTHLYFDEQVLDRVKQAAKDDFESISAWVQEACEQRLKRERKR
jgi:hypothetical protein